MVWHIYGTVLAFSLVMPNFMLFISTHWVLLPTNKVNFLERNHVLFPLLSHNHCFTLVGCVPKPTKDRKLMLLRASPLGMASSSLVPNGRSHGGVYQLIGLRCLYYKVLFHRLYRCQCDCVQFATGAPLGKKRSSAWCAHSPLGSVTGTLAWSSFGRGKLAVYLSVASGRRFF